MCECKYGLNESVCYSNQKWNRDECRCVWKGLDNWDFCEKGFMWNLSTCNSECNKAFKIDEYLNIKNCSCEKRLIGKLVLGCEDKIFNTTETSPYDKKSNMWKKELS